MSYLRIILRGIQSVTVDFALNVNCIGNIKMTKIVQNLKYYLLLFVYTTFWDVCRYCSSAITKLIVINLCTFIDYDNVKIVFPNRKRKIKGTQRVNEKSRIKLAHLYKIKMY